jgi:broad specificity phosphatase PhoE
VTDRRRTTRLWLVCHPSTSALRSSAFPADEPLEPKALRELRVAAPQLRNADRCWTSPALRAIHTAEALGMTATVDPLLRECDYGEWAGRTLDEVHARDPEAVASWLSDPQSAPHGGESIRELVGRVATWLQGQRELPGKILAITHASVIRAAVVHVLRAPAQSFWRIDVAPLSLTKLNSAGEHWTLASLGEPLTLPPR